MIERGMKMGLAVRGEAWDEYGGVMQVYRRLGRIEIADAGRVGKDTIMSEDKEGRAGGESDEIRN